MAFTRSLYKLGFQLSPVILCDGIAASITGGMLPIVALTEAATFVESLVSGDFDLTNTDSYFCHWKVAPGGTLINDQIASYPFANQQVAANAILAQPNSVSMIMEAPMNEHSGAMTRLTTLSALQAVLQAHRNLGGTYTIATPAAIYSACVLTSLRDVTPAGRQTPQETWQWEFVQPLITQSSAAAAVNSLLGKIDGGDVVTSSSWTSTTAALGNTSLGGTVSSVAESIIGLVGKLGL